MEDDPGDDCGHTGPKSAAVPEGRSDFGWFHWEKLSSGLHVRKTIFEAPRLTSAPAPDETALEVIPIDSEDLMQNPQYDAIVVGSGIS